MNRGHWHKAVSATLLTGLFFLLILVNVYPYLDFVPIWDGWYFYECYLKASNNYFASCYNHSTVWNSIYFGFPLQFVTNKLLAVRLLSIFLISISAAGMFWFARTFPGRKLSVLDCFLIALVFALSPVWTSGILHHSLDFALPAYGALLLLAMRFERAPWIALIGCFMAFTKETGTLAYAGIMSVYSLRYLLRTAPSRGPWKAALHIAILTIPGWLFLLYMKLFPLHALDATGKGGQNLLEFLIDFLGPNEDGTFALAQFYNQSVLNFSWIATAIIAALMLAQTRRVRAILKDARGFSILRKLLGIDLVFYGSMFLVVFYLLTRVEFVNNPRYTLPLWPLFIATLGAGFSSAPVAKVWLRPLIVVLALGQIISSHRTVDPVSKSMIGTFAFGQHEMLSPGTIDRMVSTGHGRDELVYNFEFTHFPGLLEKVVQHYGPLTTFVTNRGFTWENYETLRYFDPHGNHRVYKTEPHIVLNIHYVERTDSIISAGEQPRTIMYIDFPNVSSERDFLFLNDLKKTGSRVFSESGYSLRVDEYESKP